MKSFNEFKKRLNEINIGNKGMGAMEIPTAIMGLLIATLFIVYLVPDIISNLTGMSVSGASGIIFTVILPLIIAYGLFYMLLKHMGIGIKGFGGK